MNFCSISMPPLIAGGGQPPASTIAGNDGFYACTRDSSSRAVAEAAWGSGDANVPSIATRQPRPQAVGARGAPHLPLGFTSKPSLSAPWARGLLSASWGRGTQTCLPAAQGVVPPAAWYDPSLSATTQDPREADDTKTSSGAASLGWLTRSGENKRGAPREVSVT